MKRAAAGEKFVTLDGVERTLNAEDLVIADAPGAPLALAGVFGGKTSGVSPATTRVFLESAYFAPAAVRKTSQTHQLKTDASFRFERGTDPDMVPVALRRAALLLQEVAGARVAAPGRGRVPATHRPHAGTPAPSPCRSAHRPGNPRPPHPPDSGRLGHRGQGGGRRGSRK